FPRLSCLLLVPPLPPPPPLFPYTTLFRSVLLGAGRFPGGQLAGDQRVQRRVLGAGDALVLPPLRAERVQPQHVEHGPQPPERARDRKSTRLNSSHVSISYAVFCLKKKKEL